jgi:heat shock protein HslJ
MRYYSLIWACCITILSCGPKPAPVTTVPEAAPPATQQQDFAPELAGTYWKLTELYGEPIRDENPKRGGFIMFRPDGQMTASAGCNSITGTYTQKPGMGISFGTNMASTLMGCPNQAREDNLKKMLAEVNSYVISGNKLSFSVNKMAPAARYESVAPEK